MDARLGTPRCEGGALAGVAIIAAAVVWFYVFVSGALFEHHSFRKDNQDFYPLLVDGFLGGRLGFMREPPPRLATLTDPYNPVLRQEAGLTDLHDVSYYKGRYYLYFGVAPALTLFLPFRALTGVHFPQEIATLLFCAGGYFCSLALFLGLQRRHFPDTSAGWLWFGALMLGLGNFCPSMVARNSIWEVPISSAYFYSSLGLLLLFKASQASRKRVLLLAMAGLALGLCVASRPHFIFFCGMLGGFWVWDAFRRIRSEGPATPPLVVARETAALFLPIAAIVAGLLIYNYERFENPWEFGQHLQLGGIEQTHLPSFSPRFIPVDFYYYFLAPAQFQRYFPFVAVIRGYLGARPDGYTGIEDPFGILPNLPWFWLGLLAPLAWAWRGRGHPELGRWLVLLGLCFFGIAGPSLCVNAAMNRYMVDFLPSLALLSAVVLLVVGRRGGMAAAPWFLLRAGIAAAMFYSAAFCALAAINHNDIFATNEPAAFRAIAKVFNRPVLAWEASHPEAYGPVEVTVRFPMDHPGAAEPILVTGISYHSDYLYVVYTPDGRHVQLGFNHTNYNQRLSQQIPIDYRAPHVIGIQMGSLYPARTHPYFAGWKSEAVHAAKHTLTVTLDGVPYLSAEQNFFDSTPGFVKFGDNDVSVFTSRKFSGQIIALKRQPLPPTLNAFVGNGFLKLSVIFPPAKPGMREPLLSTGTRGRGDLLFVEYLDRNLTRLGFEHTGRAPEFSPPFAVERGLVQTIEASLGSFYGHPSDARERELARTLFIRVDGQILWVKNEPFYPAGSQPPAVCENAVGSPSTGPAFSGRVAATDTEHLLPVAPDSPFAFAPYWIETGTKPSYGPARIRLALAPQVMTPIESLIVTGPSRATADYVSMSYPDARQVVFGYLQTGSAALKSRRFFVDHKSPLVVEIAMPSLYPSETDPFFANCTLDEILEAKKGVLNLKVNGQMLLNAPVGYFESAADEITFGENRVSNVYEYAPAFTARILSIERACYAPPPGFAENDGPIELVLTLPSTSRQSEVVLASGATAAPDLLLAASPAPGQFKFSVRTAGGGSIESEPVSVDPDSRHTLVVQWGGLYSEGDRRHQVSVRLDGKPILSGRMDFQFPSPQSIAIGKAGQAGHSFSGLIHSARRLPSSKAPL